MIKTPFLSSECSVAIYCLTSRPAFIGRNIGYIRLTDIIKHQLKNVWTAVRVIAWLILRWSRKWRISCAAAAQVCLFRCVFCSHWPPVSELDAVEGTLNNAIFSVASYWLYVNSFWSFLDDTYAQLRYKLQRYIISSQPQNSSSFRMAFSHEIIFWRSQYLWWLSSQLFLYIYWLRIIYRLHKANANVKQSAPHNVR